MKTRGKRSENDGKCSLTQAVEHRDVGGAGGVVDQQPAVLGPPALGQVEYHGLKKKTRGSSLSVPRTSRTFLNQVR